MKLRLALLAMVLFLGACASGGWRVINDEEFTIEFPGIPLDTATAVADASGAKLYYIPAEQGLDSNAYYSVSVYTLPDSVALLGDELGDVLLKDAEIYAWSMGAFLTDSGSVVKSGNYEGREFTIFLDQNAGVVKMRKFPKGKNLYTLLVITQNAYMDNADVYRFMNSFKLK